MIKHIFITLFSLVLSQNLLAHYIWVEAQTSGNAGEKQLVKIFYGEFENNRKEEAGKRLEEVNGLVAWVLNPSGEKIILYLIKKENHFLSEFIPAKAGRYEILVMNNVREVVDWSAYDIGIIKPVYYSRQVFFAYDPNTKVAQSLPASSAPALELDLLPVYKNTSEINSFATGTAVCLNAYYKGTTLPKGKLLVYAPNGWMKELERGEDGLFTFTPLEKGQYIVECVYKEKTSGIFKKKNYDAIRHRVALTISVN